MSKLNVAKESKRLEVLNTYNLLQGPLDPDFQKLTELAAFISKCPYAFFNIVAENKILVKASVGVTKLELPKDESLCFEVAKNKSIITIKNVQNSEYRNSPIMKNSPFVFYIGFPLIESSGECLGTLCLLDTQERELTLEEISHLTTIASQFVKLISTRKVISHALQQQRASAIGELSAGIAHEINNPLTILQGNLGLIKFSPSQDKLNERVDKSEKSIERIAKIVKSLNLFTSESHANHTFLFSKFWSDFSSVIRFIPRLSSITLKEDFDFEDITIEGNSPSLQQALFNLVKNAVEEASNANKKEVVIKGTVREGNLVFSVSDYGSGITESHKHKIFEPFFTTKEVGQGMGLGLAVVSGVARNHKGSVKVANLSNPTKLELSIPLKAS